LQTDQRGDNLSELPVRNFSGPARIAFGNELRRSPADPDDRDQVVIPGEWLRVPDGDEAEVTVRGGFGSLGFQIFGETLVAFDQPEDAFEHVMVLNICRGRLVLNVNGENNSSPRLGLRVFEQPQSADVERDTRPGTLVLPGGRYTVEIEVDAGGRLPEIRVTSTNPKVLWQGKTVSAPE
jgi:hypothetical protein